MWQTEEDSHLSEEEEKVSEIPLKMRTRRLRRRRERQETSNDLGLSVTPLGLNQSTSPRNMYSTIKSDKLDVVNSYQDQISSSLDKR